MTQTKTEQVRELLLRWKEDREEANKKISYRERNITLKEIAKNIKQNIIPSVGLGYVKETKKYFIDGYYYTHVDGILANMVGTHIKESELYNRFDLLGDVIYKNITRVVDDLYYTEILNNFIEKYVSDNISSSFFLSYVKHPVKETKKYFIDGHYYYSKLNFLVEKEFSISLILKDFEEYSKDKNIHAYGLGQNVKSKLASDISIQLFNFIIQEKTIFNSFCFIPISSLIASALVKGSKLNPDHIFGDSFIEQILSVLNETIPRKLFGVKLNSFLIQELGDKLKTHIIEHHLYELREEVANQILILQGE
jgi:hypothetical protein